jgi:hypothetical protein
MLLDSVFGWLGRRPKTIAYVDDIEAKLIAVRGSLSLAVVRLYAAQRAGKVGTEQFRIIDEVINILERAKLRALL